MFRNSQGNRSTIEGYRETFDNMTAEASSAAADMTFVKGLRDIGARAETSMVYMSQDHVLGQRREVHQLTHLFGEDLITNLLWTKKISLAQCKQTLNEYSDSSISMEIFDRIDSRSFVVREVAKALHDFVQGLQNAKTGEAMAWAADNKLTILVYLLENRNNSRGATVLEGRSDLAWAASQGHSSLVRLLLALGADTDRESKYKCMAV